MTKSQIGNIIQKPNNELGKWETQILNGLRNQYLSWKRICDFVIGSYVQGT